MNETVNPFKGTYFVCQYFDMEKNGYVYQVIANRVDAINYTNEKIENDVDAVGIVMYAVDQWFIYEDNGLRFNIAEYEKYMGMLDNDLGYEYWINNGFNILD